MKNREENYLKVFDTTLDKLEKHWNDLAVLAAANPPLKKHSSKAMALISELTMLRDMAELLFDEQSK